MDTVLVRESDICEHPCVSTPRVGQLPQHLLLLLLQVPTACPKGQFTAAAYCDVGAYCLKPSKSVTEHEQQPGSQLLAQLQVCFTQLQQQRGAVSCNPHQTRADPVDCVFLFMQDCNARAQRLLTLLSIHREQVCRLQTQPLMSALRQCVACSAL
jgi:hypothetical protein